MKSKVKELENFFKTGYPFPMWLDDGRTIMVRSEEEALEIMKTGKVKSYLPLHGKAPTKIVYNK